MPRRKTARGLNPAMDSPRNRTEPALGRSSPLITRRTVDLPAPFGPTMQERLPSSTVRSTPWRTSPPPYPARTPDISSTAMSGSQVGVEDGRILPHLARTAARDRATMMQDDHLRAEIHHESHVVL